MIDEDRSFEAVQTLRNTHDKLLYASALCEGNLDVVQQIIVLAKDRSYKQSLESIANRLRARIKSTRVANSRIQNATDLV